MQLGTVAEIATSGPCCPSASTGSGCTINRGAATNKDEGAVSSHFPRLSSCLIASRLHRTALEGAIHHLTQQTLQRRHKSPQLGPSSHHVCVHQSPHAARLDQAPSPGPRPLALERYGPSQGHVRMTIATMGVADIFTSLVSGLLPRDSVRYRYSAIPAPMEEDESSSSSQQQQQQPPPGEELDGRRARPREQARLLKLTAGAMILFAVLAVAAVYGRSHHSSRGCEATGACDGVSPHTWGQYSPYFSAPSTVDPALPAGCELTFAAVLSRHGARYPTAAKSAPYHELIARIHASVSKYGKGFEFIRDYSFTNRADDLTLYGEKELVQSGATFYRRYQELARDSEPFVRAAGSPRVVMSAQNFTTAFYEAQGKIGDGKLDQILVLPEKAGFNNTLDHGTCPVFEDGPWATLGHDKQAKWRSVWAAPIMDRLNYKLPGANLTLQETVYIMDLCPFGTVSTPNATKSGFCRLFSQEEWRGYDYHGSLDKWYSFGNGNPLGPTQGVGYVNELIARLTGKALQDETSTNSTMGSSPETFPLDRKLYADFSHDNLMTSVYAALGLYNRTENLPDTYKLSPRKTHGYSTSWTVPFAGRMYVEKMRCDASKGDDELVRVLVDDRVVPLQGCRADKLGRCRLRDFVQGLSFARSGGHWPLCYA
ncbi:3-phytase [Purpureocillium takamizusanense]|uniref:3-phytase n=1 Tax=Purpureocillium takamizusanense TaxID=2060973 RepID=A0A9Q8QNR4_9HYPO|nr:3-phytase [Purpureocillium takamizusanense]UNI22049.1 3-phytase [Purpureocillium takamizusanense]